MSVQYGNEWSGAPARKVGRLARLLREIVAGLDALHRAQFETPWAKVERRKAAR